MFKISVSLHDIMAVFALFRWSLRGRLGAKIATMAVWTTCTRCVPHRKIRRLATMAVWTTCTTFFVFSYSLFFFLSFIFFYLCIYRINVVHMVQRATRAYLIWYNMWYLTGTCGPTNFLR